jgi:hypothetical protein
MTRLLLAAAVLAVAPLDHAHAESQQGKKPAWQSDYSKARAEAKKGRKLLFVVFRCQP